MAKRTAKRSKKAISATQARRLAAKHVMARMFDNATVRDGAEIDGRIYSLPCKELWMVFPNRQAEISTLCSSPVVGVCKRTGRVRYTGPANDEG